MNDEGKSRDISLGSVPLSEPDKTCSSAQLRTSYRALYLHIPFCAKRCKYCDFATTAVLPDDPAMDDYLERLIQQVRTASRSGELEHVKTIYIGGGTPTFFGHKRLVELAYTLSLSINLENVREYTLEVNPDSLTPAMVRDLYALGVDRLSIGVQSFNDLELAALGRIHTSEQARKAVGMARERFENISLDLMCGIPGQTPDSWQHTLEEALRLEPQHLSIYPLQLEEGTGLFEAVEQGAVFVPDEDVQAEYLLQAAGVLEARGYHRYEVASYALPGFESAHNLAYWTGVSYLGMGTGAAGMQNREDGSRIRRTEGEEPEILTPEEAVAEDLLLAMRTAQGVQEEFLISSERLLPGVSQVFEELQELGLIVYANKRFLPTEKGWLLGNELYARIWQLASP